MVVHAPVFGAVTASKNAVSLAFALLDQKPTQDISIDIHGLLVKEAEQRLPVLIQQKLDRLLR